MQLLHQLAHSLSPKELGVIKNYLHCFSSHQGSEATLTQQLFDYLLRQKETPSENDSCTVVYGTHRNKEEVFEKLKQRLRNKILEAISLDVNSEKKVFLDEVDTASMRIKKKSAQVRFLFYAKPALDVTLTLLDEIIADCKKYELYQLLVEHLKFKLWGYTFKEGEKEFGEVSGEVERYEECNHAVYKANNYHYQLIFRGEHTAKYDLAQVQSFLEGAIAELKRLHDKTKSNTVNYFLKYLEVNYFMNCKDYIQARRICLDLVKLVRNDPAVKRKQRIGIAYDYFSRCELYMGNFVEAEKCAKSAQENFMPASHNFSVSLEQEFYALFAMRKHDKSAEIANRLLSCASRKELGEFRFAKYNYLLANALFMQRRFGEALDLLAEQRELAKDKAGWETGIRILRIMTLIEMLQLDEASLAISSLKQFFKYTDKKTPIRPRDKKILSLLLVAEKKGFAFSSLLDNTEEYLNALTTDASTRWEPFTHELIPFHEWFAGKMRNKALPLVTKATNIPASKEKVLSR